jgi:hypothetical protein
MHDCDEHDKKLLADIERYGWHMIGIKEDSKRPAFVFTVGLFQTFKHPEIIMFGLQVENMYEIVRSAVDHVKEGKKYDVGNNYDEILEAYPVTFVEVKKDFYDKYLGYALWFYEGPNFPAIQCVWPDKEMKWPFNFAAPVWVMRAQPLLDRNERWPFEDPKNFAVFTTRRVIEEKYPILLVTHDEPDGDWQFLCGTTNESSDCKVICLNDATVIDPSVIQLADLPLGWQAIRNNPSEPWRRMPKQSQED